MTHNDRYTAEGSTSRHPLDRISERGRSRLLERLQVVPWARHCGEHVAGEATPRPGAEG